jgi:hypothetical protein
MLPVMSGDNQVEHAVRLTDARNGVVLQSAVEAVLECRRNRGGSSK